MAYISPTSATLKARYPAFVTVADATVETWLAEAAEDCANWSESLRARGEMALAAHKMAELGIVTGLIPAGVTSFKSGTFSATVSDKAASASGYDATVYGREFKQLARALFGGPRLAWSPPAC
jgi:hypothetical protein